MSQFYLFYLGFHKGGEGYFFCFLLLLFKISEKELKEKLSILCADDTEQCPSGAGWGGAGS